MVTKRLLLAPEIAIFALEVPEVPLRSSEALEIVNDKELTVTLLAKAMLCCDDATIEALVVEIVMELDAAPNTKLEAPVDEIVQLVVVTRSDVTDDPNWMVFDDACMSVFASKNDRPTFETTPAKFKAVAADEVMVAAPRTVSEMGEGFPTILDAKYNA
jgi:hypothetical protein